jgi:hypothetical protein
MARGLEPAQPFLFWEYPLSDLGRCSTAAGAPNWASLAAFCFGMVRGALTMSSLGASFLRERRAGHSVLEAALAFSAAAGFLGTCVPHDLCHTGHVIGSAMMVFSLWALAVLLLVEAARRAAKALALSGQLLLQGTVLTYAVAYVADLPFKQAAQKCAVAGLFLVLCLASTALARAREARARSPVTIPPTQPGLMSPSAPTVCSSTCAAVAPRGLPR